MVFCDICIYRLILANIMSLGSSQMIWHKRDRCSIDPTREAAKQKQLFAHAALGENGRWWMQVFL